MKREGQEVLGKLNRNRSGPYEVIEELIPKPVTHKSKGKTTEINGAAHASEILKMDEPSFP